MDGGRWSLKGMLFGSIHRKVDRLDDVVKNFRELAVNTAAMGRDRW